MSRKILKEHYSKLKNEWDRVNLREAWFSLAETVGFCFVLGVFFFGDKDSPYMLLGLLATYGLGHFASEYSLKAEGKISEIFSLWDNELKRDDEIANLIERTDHIYDVLEEPDADDSSFNELPKTQG